MPLTMAVPDVLDPLYETARLAQLEALGLLGAGPEPRFDRLTSLAAQVLGMPVAAVNLVAADEVVAKAAVGTSVRALPRSVALCSQTIAGAGTLVVEDAAADPRFRDNPLVTGPAGIRFYAGHPLRSSDGYPIGALCVIDVRPREFGDAQRATLQSMAALVEREIDYQDERDRAAHLQRSLLPARTEDVGLWQAAGVSVPAHRVGGDFFDWYSSGSRLVVTVADVMGKGMPAAILAAGIRAVLRAETRRTTPAAALRGAALALADDLDATGSFASVFHAAFDEDGTVSLADAGHGLAVVIRAGSGVAETLDHVRGVPLGVPGAEQVAGAELTLRPGDTLAIFSDGLLDLAGDLGQAARTAADLVRGDLAGLPGRVQRLVASAPRTDDVTVVAVRMRDR